MPENTFLLKTALEKAASRKPPIDGLLIDATLSMIWADYRKGSKKAKVHVGLDLNRSIPTKVQMQKLNRKLLSPDVFTLQKKDRVCNSNLQIFV